MKSKAHMKHLKIWFLWLVSKEYINLHLRDKIE